MTLNDVLQDLIERLDSNENHPISEEQIREWPENAVAIFQDAGWIKPLPPAKSVECPGCEENCCMPVHSIPPKNGQPSRNYVACDRRDDMGRIPIPPDMLEQWQITEYPVARWIGRTLGLKGKAKKDKESGAIHIGNVQGKNRNSLLKWVPGPPVSLQASGHSLWLIDVIQFKGSQIQVDQAAIMRMVDRPPPADGYSPSTAKREARKLNTQALHMDWQKAYRKLKKDKPGKSDSWYAQEISRMNIAQGRKSETIRKNMKK